MKKEIVNQGIDFNVNEVVGLNSKKGYVNIEYYDKETGDHGSAIRKKYDKYYRRSGLYETYTIFKGCKITLIDSETLDKYNNQIFKVDTVERLYNTNTEKNIIKKDTSSLGKDYYIYGKEINEIKNKAIDDAWKILKREELDKRVEDFDNKLKEKAREEVSKKVENIENKNNKKNEIRHEKYDDIRQCLENGIPVFLRGDAGSGKNYTVEQIARDLNWKFFYTNSIQQEYKLTGFTDAGGNYHDTEFYKACTSEEDCIFFIDEIDASIPEVLVLINSAISNGYFEFPNGRVQLNKVHFVCAGNTSGSGADEMYTGRLVLDMATLDRFIFIDFDYDKKVELHLANGNKELIDFIQDLRERAKETGVRAIFSMRCIINVTKLEKAGMDLNKILKYAVVKDLDSDTISTLRSGLAGYTRYHEAINQMIA